MRLLPMILLALLAAMPGRGLAQLVHPPGRFVPVRDGRIWHEVEGRGEPLVLIAGGPGLSHAYFHPWFSGLADRFRIVYFDAAGTGRSTSRGGYTLAGAVEDVEALRRSLGRRRINLFGHSYGGIVALAYAERYPGHVGRLAIANIVASGEELQLVQDNLNQLFHNQAPEAWVQLERLRARGIRSSAAAHQQAYAAPLDMLSFRDPDDGARMPRGEPGYYNPDPWYALAGEDADFTVAGELRRFDVRRTAASLPMPLLVIGGRYDRLIYPALIERWRGYAPQARIVYLERSGHFPFLEQTEETLALLRTFFSGG